LGVPTGFGYTLHLYGPYSEDLQAEIGLLVNLGFVKEYPHFSNEFTTYYTLIRSACEYLFAAIIAALLI
jgi:uncharacterized protein YwgA